MALDWLRMIAALHQRPLRRWAHPTGSITTATCSRSFDSTHSDAMARRRCGRHCRWKRRFVTAPRRPQKLLLAMARPRGRRLRSPRWRRNPRREPLRRAPPPHGSAGRNEEERPPPRLAALSIMVLQRHGGRSDGGRSKALIEKTASDVGLGEVSKLWLLPGSAAAPALLRRRP